MTSPSLPNLIDYDTERLKTEFEKLGLEKFRAVQIQEWIYRKGVYETAQMGNLPRSAKEKIESHFSVNPGKICKANRSKDDQSIKLLLELADGEMVETVYIPKRDRQTVCVSSQVGCKFKCAFCASGQDGFFRNLTVGEIVSQVLRARDQSPNLKITNIVFMGIGEPLDNFDNVLGAIRLLNNPELFGIGARKITISTCGVVPKIRLLSEQGLQIELSVSLHGATDEIRGKIMPVNKAFPLADLLPACRDYVEKTKREITFEYILADGLNASLHDAAELLKVLKSVRCKINLIPLNPIPEFPYKRPSVAQIRDFEEKLNKGGIRTTVRFSSGTDINAACGQLRSVELKKGK